MTNNVSPYVPAFKRTKVTGAIKKKRVLQYLVSDQGKNVITDHGAAWNAKLVSVANRAELSELLGKPHQIKDHKIPFEGFFTGVLFVGETIVDDD